MKIKSPLLVKIYLQQTCLIILRNKPVHQHINTPFYFVCLYFSLTFTVFPLKGGASLPNHVQSHEQADGSQQSPLPLHTGWQWHHRKIRSWSQTAAPAGETHFPAENQHTWVDFSISERVTCRLNCVFSKSWTLLLKQHNEGLIISYRAILLR